MEWEQFIVVCREQLHILKAARGAGEVTERESWLCFILHQHYRSEDLDPGMLIDEFGEEYLPPIPR